MVLVRGQKPAKVRQKSQRYPEVRYKALGFFMRIKRPRLTAEVDLRRLEAAKDDPALVSQHTPWSVEAQPVGVSQERLHRVDDCAEIALVSKRRYGDGGSNFVFS